jgi:hypothetical protein
MLPALCPAATLLAPGCEGDSGTEAGCRVPVAYGDLGHVEGSSHAGPHWFSVPTRERLSALEGVTIGINLAPGRGVFREGLASGVFELVGDELQRDRCGACISMRFSDPDDPDYPVESYQITGGTLGIIDLLDEYDVPQRMTGYLANAKFVQVDAEKSTPAPDGCETFIERLEFDEEILYTD